MKSLLRTTVLFAVAGGLLAAPAAAEAAPTRPGPLSAPHGTLLTPSRQPSGSQQSAPGPQHAPVAAALRPTDPAPPAAAPQDRRAHEAVEFFWYNCSHSAQLEEPLSRWAARHADDVTLRRVPAIWTGSPDEAEQRGHARMFYTLDRLGEVDRLQAEVFRAVREQHADLTTEQAATDWAAAHGVDADSFRTAYRSAEVDRAVDEAPQVFTRNAITELPTVVVDGDGRTSPTGAGGVDGMPSALDRLVADEPGAA